MNTWAPILNAMSAKEKREIRQLLREEKEAHCLDRAAHLKTLAIAIGMPLGECKAKIIKSWIEEKHN